MIAAVVILSLVVVILGLGLWASLGIAKSDKLQSDWVHNKLNQARLELRQVEQVLDDFRAPGRWNEETPLVERAKILLNQFVSEAKRNA